MSVQKQQKVCKTCEGRVDFDVIFCPFCGTDLLEENACVVENEEATESLTAGPGSISSFYSDLGGGQSDGHLYVKPGPSQEGPVFFPYLLLSLASWLFTLSFLLFTLSEHGQLVLFFDAKLWFLYLFFSVPLGVLGWKFLEKQDGS